MAVLSSRILQRRHVKCVGGCSHVKFVSVFAGISVYLTDFSSGVIGVEGGTFLRD